MTATDRIAYGMQVQGDRLRCGRGGCVMDGPAIPVIWGDLAGKTLGQWIAKAVKTIEGQHPPAQARPHRRGAAKPPV